MYLNDDKRVINKFIDKYADIIVYPAMSDIDLYILSTGAGMMMSIADIVFQSSREFNLKCIDLSSFSNKKNQSMIIDYCATYEYTVLCLWLSITNPIKIIEDLKHRGHNTSKAILYINGNGIQYSSDFRKMGYKIIEKLDNIPYLISKLKSET